jgi:hypothetical protein
MRRFPALLVLAAFSPGLTAADRAPAWPQANGPFGNFTPRQSGDRLLAIRDASHSDTELAFISADPKDFRPLAGFWAPPHLQTTAYEVYMEHPCVNGRIYLRTKDGRVACYDLRK